MSSSNSCVQVKNNSMYEKKKMYIFIKHVLNLFPIKYKQESVIVAAILILTLLTDY